MLRIYRFIRFLSLDIVLGVAACSILACIILKLYPPASYKILLLLSVWILYLTDHLLDGMRHSNKIPVTRYKQYSDKAKLLLILIMLLILIALGVLIFSFDRITFHFGILVGIVVLGYFVFQQLRFRGIIKAFPKEPIIAVVYTLGIWGVPLIIFKGAFGIELYLVLLSFTLLVLMNVQLYSILQVDEDSISGYATLASEYGVKFVKGLNLSIGIIVAILCLAIILGTGTSEFRYAGIIFLLMDISLFYLTLLSRFPESKETIGMLADAIFLLPFIILLLKG